MGNDGGTIASRQDILSLHSYGKNCRNEKKEIADDDESSILTTCALSSLPLFSPEQPPVVSDYKGKLYLKEKTLEYIIKQKTKDNDFSDKNVAKNNKSSPFSHIRSMNDIVDIHIKWRTDTDSANPSIECPISKELKNSNTVYAYLRPCGCVLSFKFLEGFTKYFEKSNNKPDDALGEMECPNCGKMFCFKYDVVILNPLDIAQYTEFNERSLKFLQDNLLLTHSKNPKKNKKKRKDRPQTEHDSTSYSKKRISDVNSTTNSTKKIKK